MTPELVAAALRYSGAELPLAWLNSELPGVLESVAELATQRGEEEPGGGLGAVTRQEAQEAWTESQGNVDEAACRCLNARRSKVGKVQAGCWRGTGGGEKTSCDKEGWETPYGRGFLGWTAEDLFGNKGPS